MTVSKELLAFWRDAGMGRWFGGGVAFDEECRARWQDVHFAAARREHDGWMETADCALALHFATRAIGAGFDAQVEPALRFFFYLPFEHSEAMADQQRAVELFTALDDANLLGYAVAHREVIAQFGRFPHRNAALGRTSTPDEQAWLEAGGGF